MTRRQKAEDLEGNEFEENDVQVKDVKPDILLHAFGNTAYTVHPLPEGLNKAAATAAIDELIAEGLVHDKACPNLTRAGVEVAREL